MATICIHETLQKFASNRNCIELHIDSLHELKSSLSAAFPRLAELIFIGEDKLHGYVALFLNGQLICSLNEEPLCATDKIELICSMAGG